MTPASLAEVVGLNRPFQFEITQNGTPAYAMVRKEPTMEAVKVGMREFRDKLATYLLESDSPVTITRHGDTVGYFIPARRKLLFLLSTCLGSSNRLSQTTGYEHSTSANLPSM